MAARPPRRATPAGQHRDLKGALDGAYHSFGSFKYVHPYLTEAACWLNRRFELDALVPRLLVEAARGNAWAERKLRVVPVYASRGIPWL